MSNLRKKPDEQGNPTFNDKFKENCRLDSYTRRPHSTNLENWLRDLPFITPSQVQHVQQTLDAKVKEKEAALEATKQKDRPTLDTLNTITVLLNANTRRNMATRCCLPPNDHPVPCLRSKPFCLSEVPNDDRIFWANCCPPIRYGLCIPTGIITNIAAWICCPQWGYENYEN